LARVLADGGRARPSGFSCETLSVVRWNAVALVARRVGLVGGWFLAVAMLIACLLRLLGADGESFAIAVVSALPWVLLPALPVAVASALCRRWALVGVASASVLAGAVWEGPTMWPFSSAAPAAAGPRVRLFDANVAQDNFHLSGIAAEIRTDRPDVIALEELTPLGLRSLQGSGVLDGYGWKVVDAQYGAGGMGLWSRLPASGLSIWSIEENQVEIDGWIDPPRRSPIRIDVMHVYAPAFGTGEPALWVRQLGELRAHLAAEPRPLLVAGDFNATADDRPFQRILGVHLQDAAVLAGKGWEMTWPRNQAWVIPYLRIDHVLLSPQLTVTRYRLGTGRGSDHRPIVADVAYRA
jgi:endonuclease/exonuclease/phosphatase (EEP) superfamily protein YafD